MACGEEAAFITATRRLVLQLCVVLFMLQRRIANHQCVSVAVTWKVEGAATCDRTVIRFFFG